MTRLQVRHETIYRYDWPVEQAQHLAFLRPLADGLQRPEGFDLSIEPAPSQRREDRDVFGNHRCCFGVHQPHRELRVLATTRVRLAESREVVPQATPRWEAVAERLRYAAGRPFEPASEFVTPSPFVPRLRALREYAVPSFKAGRPVAEAAVDLMHRVHADFRYESASTDVDTPLAEVLVDRRGVCQDFAHLMIGALRMMGLAARYVSGYLLTRAAPGQPVLQGADASHAWVSVWCPGVHPDAPDPADRDWLELDPTNDLLPTLSHVRVARGRDYGDVTPLRGVIRGGGRHRLTVQVHTERTG
jgi:transglutaminase-like putative cysteine protease